LIRKKDHGAHREKMASSKSGKQVAFGSGGKGKGERTVSAVVR